MKKINKRFLVKLVSMFFLMTFLVAGIFLGSCRRKLNEKEIQLNLDCNPVDLNLEFYIPLHISYIDGRFFIADFHGERMIREISRETALKVSDFGVRGKGPVEFIGPLSIWEFGQKLYVYDRQAFKLSYFDVMTPDPLSVYKYTELFSVDNSISRLISLSQNSFLAIGFFEQGRYALLDSLGRVINYFGDYPAFKTGEDKIPFDAKAMFHQVSDLVANYEKQRIAVLSSHVLDILDYSGPEPKVLVRKNLADYGYDYRSGGVISARLKDGFIRGARSATGCSKFIYVLFNPKIRGDVIEDGSNFLELWVFDWDGKLVAKHKVLCDLDEIKAVESSLLYGITMDLDFISLDFRE